jgi:hypothetical protein
VKIFYCLSILSLSCFFIHAQEIVTTSGGSDQNKNLIISWTLGEPITETFSNSNFTVTQGMQQSLLTITIINEITEKSILISASPNPVKDLITIKIDNLNDSKFQYTLIDMRGKILEQKLIKDNNTEVSFGLYVSGIFFLKITKSEKEIKTFKIIKL